ncbi:MAG: hypothetical protein COT43_03100, partial [Candidatus Marinimicrobia bacterium CG08_land_8_20_14_0_20_45_22]
MKKTCLLIVTVGLILSSSMLADNLIGNSGFEDQSPAFWNVLNGTFGTELGVGTDTSTNVKTGFR